MEIFRLMGILLLAILLIIIGSKVLYKDDFAVISGSVTLNANTQENATKNIVTMTSVTIDYPNGFNKNNSVVISFGRQDASNLGDGYGWTNNITSAEQLSGIQPFNIQLFGDSTTSFANKILLQMGNLATSTKNANYKIVLMKVN